LVITGNPSTAGEDVVILSDGGVEGMGEGGANRDIFVCFKDCLTVFFARFFVIAGGIEAGLVTSIDAGRKYAGCEG
jgi:hypothetical protein